jgi:hypothetical protein
MARSQKELPGVEAPSIPEIEAASEVLRLVREKRMKLTAQEVVAAENLKTVMNGHNTDIYRYDEYVVILTTGSQRVKVRLDRDKDTDIDDD